MKMWLATQVFISYARFRAFILYEVHVSTAVEFNFHLKTSSNTQYIEVNSDHRFEHLIQLI